MDNNIFLKIPALKVEQPLGAFYVISISAKHLLDISFSEPLKYIDNSGNVKGTQRIKDKKRLQEIAQYIESAEMAFPNSIILAANYGQNGEIVKDENERWRIEQNGDNYSIIIPKKSKLASVIDGQHRLNAFEYVNKEDRFSSLQLVCSVYFDLPNSYQAFLFATINSNQKKVDRSLALDLFGYNVDDEPEKAWTPEKFAVFLSRKLNLDKDSSKLFMHIKVAPLGVENLFDPKEEIHKPLVISTATIVDGICSLISSNVKRDRIIMQQQKNFLTGRTRNMIAEIKDLSPLRQLFIENKDLSIYNTLLNYFDAVNNVFWNKATKTSYINKTVGVQALFDILKLILLKEKSQSPEEIKFLKYLESASHVNFSDKFFQASGIGRSRIKNVIGLLTGLISKEKIKQKDIPFYEQIILGQNTLIEKERWIWEEEAENAIIEVLNNTNWNYDEKSVSIIDNYDYEHILKLNNLQDFVSRLKEVAEVAFATSLPSDEEFANEQREKFDVDDLVYSHLNEYEANLKMIGWNS